MLVQVKLTCRYRSAVFVSFPLELSSLFFSDFISIATDNAILGIGLEVNKAHEWIIRALSLCLLHVFKAPNAYSFPSEFKVSRKFPGAWHPLSRFLGRR